MLTGIGQLRVRLFDSPSRATAAARSLEGRGDGIRVWVVESVPDGSEVLE